MFNKAIYEWHFLPTPNEIWTVYRWTPYNIAIVRHLTNKRNIFERRRQSARSNIQRICKEFLTGARSHFDQANRFKSSFAERKNLTIILQKYFKQKIQSSLSLDADRQVGLHFFSILIVWCNQMGTVFTEMSSRSALTSHLGIRTTFRPNIKKQTCSYYVLLWWL